MFFKTFNVMYYHNKEQHKHWLVKKACFEPEFYFIKEILKSRKEISYILLNQIYG